MCICMPLRSKQLRCHLKVILFLTVPENEPHILDLMNTPECLKDTACCKNAANIVLQNKIEGI